MLLNNFSLECLQFETAHEEIERQKRSDYEGLLN